MIITIFILKTTLECSLYSFVFECFFMRKVWDMRESLKFKNPAVFFFEMEGFDWSNKEGVIYPWSRFFRILGQVMQVVEFYKDSKNIMKTWDQKASFWVNSKKPLFSPNFGTFSTFSEEPDPNLKIRLRYFIWIIHIFHLKKK